MSDKPIEWAGATFKDLMDDKIFTLDARKVRWHKAP